MGAKLALDRPSVGQHGLYTMEQPPSDPDCLNHRCARRQFHYCPLSTQRLEISVRTYLTSEKPTERSLKRQMQRVSNKSVSRFTFNVFPSHTHCDWSWLALPTARMRCPNPLRPPQISRLRLSPAIYHRSKSGIAHTGPKSSRNI